MQVDQTLEGIKHMCSLVVFIFLVQFFQMRLLMRQGKVTKYPCCTALIQMEISKLRQVQWRKLMRDETDWA